MKKHLTIATTTILLSACGISMNPEGSTTNDQSQVLTLAEQSDYSEQKEESQYFQDAIIKVTGAHYQSCAPMLFPSEKPKNIIKDYFDEREEYKREKFCSDRRDDNLDYVSFSKGSLEPNAGRLKESRGMVDAMQRFNCSGFVAATMTAGGLKYYKGQKDKFYSPRTHDIAKDFKRSDSCFFKPTISKKASLLPGDIINVSYGHAVRVLSVGDDPLGLSKIKKKSDCNDISQKNFDFTFVHSTSNNKTEGRNGVLVENAKNSTTSIIGKLAKYTEKLCKKKFKKDGFKGTIKDQDVGTDTIGWGWFSVKRDRVFSLRRHYGSEKSSCTYTPVKVVGGRCLSNSCYDTVMDK